MVARAYEGGYRDLEEAFGERFGRDDAVVADFEEFLPKAQEVLGTAQWEGT